MFFLFKWFFSVGFKKDVSRFCNQLDVNIPDKKHLFAPFIHESYLIANASKLSGSYESNEKLAFLGKYSSFMV